MDENSPVIKDSIYDLTFIMEKGLVKDFDTGSLLRYPSFHYDYWETFTGVVEVGKLQITKPTSGVLASFTISGIDIHWEALLWLNNGVAIKLGDSIQSSYTINPVVGSGFYFMVFAGLNSRRVHMYYYNRGSAGRHIMSVVSF